MKYDAQPENLNLKTLFMHAETPHSDRNSHSSRFTLISVPTLTVTSKICDSIPNDRYSATKSQARTSFYLFRSGNLVCTITPQTYSGIY